MQFSACSFTGHRSIAPAAREKLCDLISRAINYVYDNGCRVFYSGGAIGFDTMAAREVIRFRITHPDVRLVMLLPCENQDERWTAAQRDAYNYIIRVCDSVEYISDVYTRSCMRARNNLLVERADVVIAYCAHTRSGTAQTVRMAQALGRQVYNLYKSACSDG